MEIAWRGLGGNNLDAGILHLNLEVPGEERKSAVLTVGPGNLQYFHRSASRHPETPR